MSKKAKPLSSEKEYKDNISLTEHCLEFGDKEKLYYSAVSGTIVVKEESKESKEKAKANIFFTAYFKNPDSSLYDEYQKKINTNLDSSVKKLKEKISKLDLNDKSLLDSIKSDLEDITNKRVSNNNNNNNNNNEENGEGYLNIDDYRSQRPLTFAFNGGPGSSSIWLHLATGPMTVPEIDVRAIKPPYRCRVNEKTFLRFTDLVFIDTTGTGYSRPISENAKENEYYDFKKDCEMAANFIRLFINRYNRYESPKYLCGESYGTTRATGLIPVLQNSMGLFFNGLILISCALDFQTFITNTNNDLAHLLFVPTLCATAHYHKQLKDEFQNMPLRELLDHVEEYCTNDYLVQLFKGSSLSEDELQSALTSLSNYLGVSEKFIKQNNLRINESKFCKELLRDQGETVGRLDSRIIGEDPVDFGDRTTIGDPSYYMLLGIYNSCFKSYCKNNLKFDSDLQYHVINFDVHKSWNFLQNGNVSNVGKNNAKFLDTTQLLRDSMLVNPFLKVFIGSGYYDIATPYFATDYSIKNHLHMNISNKNKHDPKISIKYYTAGHMMYISEQCMEELHNDVQTFINESN